jgi:hypothetical protein
MLLMALLGRALLQLHAETFYRTSGSLASRLQSHPPNVREALELWQARVREILDRTTEN